MNSATQNTEKYQLFRAKKYLRKNLSFDSYTLFLFG